MVTRYLQDADNTANRQE